MVQGVCEVHRLVHNDDSIREVEYCKCCQVYMCSDCVNSGDRLIAFWRASGKNPITMMKKLKDCLGRR